MGVFKNILSRAGFIRKSDAVNYGVRAYNAGLASRLTNSWELTAATIDRDIKGGIIPIRARARNMVRNNPYGIGYINAHKTNVVGPEGFNFQWKSLKANNDPNEFANNLIERKFRDWSKKESCTMQGIFPFVIVQQLIAQQLFRDGEFLVRQVFGPSAKNQFGYALDLLETDDLDERYNEELTGGNIVKMGVEFNEWRRPVAYWLKKRTLRDELSFSDHVYTERYRVPADEIIFGFDPEHCKQTRAVSPMVQSLMSVHMADDFEQSSLVNANWSAKLLGFYEKKRIEGDPQFGDEAMEDDDGHITHDYDTGSIEELPYGTEFQNFNREYPHPMHEPFMKSMLRRIATGFGLKYSTMSNDRSDSNFSAERAASNEERDNWRYKQMIVREMFCDTVAKNWLKWALLAGALNPLEISEYDKLNVPEIRGRRWGYVDPVKDVTANKIAVEEGFKTRKDVIEEYGGNKEDVDAELRKDKPLKDELGLGSKGNITIEEVTEEENGSKEKTKLSLLANN